MKQSFAPISILMMLLFVLINGGQSIARVTAPQPHEISWYGTINNRVPVFLHYLIIDKTIVGKIIYLNTKDRKPISLLGTIQEDKSFRLLEFEKSGNITGIITGKPEKNIFTGEWFSPKSRKNFKLHLVSKDTTLVPENSSITKNEIYGTYHYQYGKEGSLGDLEIKKQKGNTVMFSIASITGAPGHNIAEIPWTAIEMTGTSFIYSLPGTTDCVFKVSFYKSFVTVNYTKGYCDGQFGMNATIDGVFLKVK